jgi:hypothetical protein
MRIQVFTLTAVLTLSVFSAGTAIAQNDHHGHAAHESDAAKHAAPGDAHGTAAAHSFDIPAGLVIEHDEIHERLVALLDAPAPVGPAAKKLADLLHHHFPLENDIALPPLGWLIPLATGAELPDATAALEQTQRLRELLPSMLEEHEEIHRAAAALHDAGREAGSESAMSFATDLQAHARHEEEILYPAAILVGDLLRARAQ